jgi:hypothetical protein
MPLDDTYQAVVARWHRYGDRKEQLDRFLLSLTEVEKMAFLVGLFDGQICQNGFQFWIHNGHERLFNDPVLESLKLLDIDVSRSVQEMVQDIAVIVKKARVLEQDDSPEADEELENLADSCSDLDQRYYACKEELMTAVEAFLRERS